MDAIRDLDPQPCFQSKSGFKPYKHQLVSFLLGVYEPQFLFFVDMGCGKSRIVLDLIRYRLQCGLQPRFLVLVPNVGNMEDWVDQATEYAPDLRVVALEGSSEQRGHTLNRDGHIFVLNYPGLVALCTSLVLTSRKDKKRKRRLDYQKLAAVKSQFNGIVLDESTAVGNHRSVTYQVCNELAKAISVRYNLTGTPFGKDPQALWPQFYFIDRGETLGPTLGLFRSAYFTKRKNYWGGYEYTFIAKRAKRLHRVLKNRSIFYKARECIDLPREISIQRYVVFTRDMEQYYKTVLEQLRAARGNYMLAKNSFLNMRQIASGFIGVQDEDTGAKAKIVFPENPKLVSLIALLDEIPTDAKVVVFYDYVYSGDRIAHALKEEGIRFETLSGAQQDKRGAVRRFRQDADCRVFLVNNKSGAFGLNLQVAQYAIYYEMPVEPLLWAQTHRRISRSGQKAKKVFFVMLMMKNSVDEDILSSHKKGEDLFKRVMSGEHTL